jgi:hypothetical protein
MNATTASSVGARAADPAPTTVERPWPPAFSGAATLIGIRIALWIGVQLLVAGVILVAGLPRSSQPLNAAAGWWMVYGSLIDLATLAMLVMLSRGAGISYRSLLGPPAAAWQIGLGAVGVLVASVPAIFFSADLTSAMFRTDTPPMLAVVDVPPVAAAFSVLVPPLLAELAEPVAYLGVVLPALERRLGRAWLAAPIVVAIWAAEHAFFPVLMREGGIDLLFAAYRVLSVLPFLAIWTALYYAFGRRLLPLMAVRWIFNGGTAFAVALGLV